MGPYKYRFRRELTLALKKVDSPSRVLDLASANAKFKHMLPADVFYLGADISKEAFVGLKADEKTRFRVGDITSSPFFLADEKPFDLVISTHTFSHIAQGLKPVALKNLISVTEGGGYLILQLTKVDEEGLSAVLSELGDVLDLEKRVRYRGVLSNLVENLFPVGFHFWSVGRMINVVLSFIDPPPFSDALFVYRKL